MKPFATKALPATVGKSGIGFGCMGITAFYGASMEDDKAMELLQAVYDAGCRHFDTAEAYKTGEKHNESVLGAFLQTVPRDSFTVATKYWPRPHGKYDYETVKESLTQSLIRLGLEYVDLYYAHRVWSLEGGLEFGRTAKRLMEEGLIREVGLSEVSGKWLKQIHTEACLISAVQQEWSLITRSLEDLLVPTCKELDVDIVAYSPLGMSLLAKRVEAPPADMRRIFPRYQPENLAENQKLVDQIQNLANKYQCTAAQLALSWLFYKADQMGVTVIPIPGSTKISNALSNLGSANILLNDPDDVALLESLADQVAGQRTTEEFMKLAIENQK